MVSKSNGLIEQVSYFQNSPEIKGTNPSLNFYSTDEIVIGKWIDEKKIYRKVVNLVGTFSDMHTFINKTTANIDFFINYYGSFIRKDAQNIREPFGISEVGNFAFLRENNEKLELHIAGYGSSVINPVIILEYTKTTD